MKLVKMRSCWSRWVPTQQDWCPYRRGVGTQMHGERPVSVETEICVTHLEPRVTQAHQQSGRREQGDLTASEEPAPPTPGSHV